MRHTKYLRLCAGALLLSSAAARADFDPGADFGVGAIRPDISTYSAFSNPTTGQTTFIVNFDGAILPASAFAARSVVGYIDLDTDKGATPGGFAPWGQPLVGGFNNWINYFHPPNPGTPNGDPGPLIELKDKYFVDLFSESFHPGKVDIIDTNTNTVFKTVSITYTATSFTLTVPLVGTGDGSLNYGMLMGSFAESTDRAPNGNVADRSMVVPALPGLVLGIVGMACILATRCRRRRPAVA
jgi:hypothetical protein